MQLADDAEALQRVATALQYSGATDPDAQARVALCAVDAIIEERGLAVVPADDGWQPIETAPKETACLIYVDRAWHYGPGIYRAMLVDNDLGRRWFTAGWAIGRDLPSDETPLKWRPLPAPPAMLAAHAAPGGSSDGG